MKIIGITGGVGAGKSELLSYIREHYNCRIIFSDDVGNEVKKKGTECYDALVNLLGREILQEDGEIDKKAMAARIFGDRELLTKVNDILHPAVNGYIAQQMELEKKKAELDFLFIEAALLIENGYKDKTDALWYIYASEDVRRGRLKAARGYSDEKITEIMGKQLSEEEFRENCDVVINNSGSLTDAYRQIDNALKI